MTRTIEITTDVFAAIWAARLEGEDTESQILERLLCTENNTCTQDSKVTPSGQINGYYDNRNDVHFHEGFTAYRKYKGKLYTAIATRGKWMLAGDNSLYPSLNKLNEAIVQGTENIWNGNWSFVDSDQKNYSIDKKRTKKP